MPMLSRGASVGESGVFLVGPSSARPEVVAPRKRGLAVRECGPVPLRDSSRRRRAAREHQSPTSASTSAKTPARALRQFRRSSKGFVSRTPDRFEVFIGARGCAQAATRCSPLVLRSGPISRVAAFQTSLAVPSKIPPDRVAHYRLSELSEKVSEVAQTSTGDVPWQLTDSGRVPPLRGGVDIAGADFVRVRSLGGGSELRTSCMGAHLLSPSPDRRGSGRDMTGCDGPRDQLLAKQTKRPPSRGMPHASRLT